MTTKSKEFNQKTNAIQSKDSGEKTSTCQNISVPKNQEPFQVPEILKGQTFLDPTYDSSFKEHFSDRKMLIHFLNGVLHLEGNKCITEIEYRDTSYTFGIHYSKLVRFDVRVVTKDEKTFDIEMQRATHSDFEDRAVLYSSMLTVSAKIDLDQNVLNLKRTKEIGRYEIPQIISIWICNFDRVGSKNFREEWGLYRKSDIGNSAALPVNDKIKYIFIELPKFKKTFKELKTNEECWLYLLKNMPEEQKTPEFKDTIFEEAYEKLRIRAESSDLIAKVVTEMITEAEIECRLDDSYKEGIEKGIRDGLKQGIEQGIEQGALQKAREMAKVLKEQGIPMEAIAKASGLSEEEIRSL